jgi:carboxypeptidase C (cathepsin A)
MSEDTNATERSAPAESRNHEPPAASQTTGTWNAATPALDYRATAGWTLLRKDEEPVAEIFSVAYVAQLAEETEVERPVTFVFNGGPGASSAFLHMGAVGPTRVAFPPDGSLPTLPPRLVPNEDSWLAFSDLVFVDPVGTGFSRIVPKDGEKPDAATTGATGGGTDAAAEFFGYKRDLESLCEFMTRWLSTQRRWGSPVFIAGESYGGYRVGRLMRMAQENAGIGLCGAVLISPALEIGGLNPGDYDASAWIDVLTTMALAAVHHGRSRAFAPDAALEDVILAVQEFSAGPYATLLIRGAALSASERAATLGRLADILGLDPGIVTRAEGRVPIDVFARELLRDERRVLGLYDATITTTDPFPDRGSFAGPDPTLAGATPAFTTAVNRQLRSEIGVETDREYVLLSLEVNQKWKNDAPEHFFLPPAGATDDFRYGMALNPHMRAFITHGRYDLVTPFATSDRLHALMRLDPATAERITVRHFGGGHMFYAWEESRREFTAAIRAFYADAIPAVG